MVNLTELKEALKYWKEEDNDEVKLLKSVYNLKSYLSLLFNPNHYDSMEGGEEEKNIDYEAMYNTLDANLKETSIKLWNNKSITNPNEYPYISTPDEQKELVIRAYLDFKEITGIN